MALKFNIFTGNFDFTGEKPTQYINGVVDAHADLPVAVDDPALESVYLVKEPSGVWLINRKPAGLYVRTANNGNLDDWYYMSAFPEVNADGNWELYNTTDPTKELKFDLSGLTTATTRTLGVPDRDGTIALKLIQTAAVYVSKSGLDTNTGTDANQPKLTIGSALTQAATLITAGATSVRIEVQDGGTYVEDITIPANVQVRAMAAQLNGTVSISAGGECFLDRHFATANNQNMVTMGDAASGPAIYSCHVMDGRGTGGTLTGVQNARNIGGGGKNLFLRVGILFVGASGVGIGDTSSGFGHIHFELEDLYLAGASAIGIQAGASGPNAANMVGVIHHILEFGSPNGCIGVSVTNSNAVVKLVAAEIASQTAYNVSSGTLYLTCPLITGARTLNIGAGSVISSVQSTGFGPVSIEATSNTQLTLKMVGSDGITRSVAFPIS